MARRRREETVIELNMPKLHPDSIGDKLQPQAV
jgi:hypothetical protein